jgi:hypothetical protein
MSAVHRTRNRDRQGAGDPHRSVKLECELTRGRSAGGKDVREGCRSNRRLFFALHDRYRQENRQDDPERRQHRHRQPVAGLGRQQQERHQTEQGDDAGCAAGRHFPKCTAAPLRLPPTVGVLPARFRPASLAVRCAVHNPFADSARIPGRFRDIAPSARSVCGDAAAAPNNLVEASGVDGQGFGELCGGPSLLPSVLQRNGGPPRSVYLPRARSASHFSDFVFAPFILPFKCRHIRACLL